MRCWNSDYTSTWPVRLQHHQEPICCAARFVRNIPVSRWDRYWKCLRRLTRGGLHRIKQPKRTTKRYLCTSRLISYRSEEHTSELQSLMRISYAVFFLNKKQETIN